MQRTKIEWVRNIDGTQGYTINPIKGICKNDCYYCYAKKMYKRFGWNKTIRLDLSVFDNVSKIKEPSKIFIGSMHDIFGDWVDSNWITLIIERCNRFKEHTFIFLTKFPERYNKFYFPPNCWLGVTITGEESTDRQVKIMVIMDLIKNIKFISYEPILYEPLSQPFFVDWVIMGGLTPKSNHRNIWIYKLIDNFRSLDTPIFIKNNLNWNEKIQEFPK